MPYSAIHHIIWDWNGTLLDDVDACVAAINGMLLRRGLPRLESHRYREIFGFPVKGYYRELGFDLEREDWDAMAKEFHEFYAVTSSDAGLHSGVTENLSAFRARGIPMSVLSASERSLLHSMMKKREIHFYFQEIRGLDDLYAHSKEDLGHELMRDLGVDPDRIVLVGDTTHDYDVASTLGCRCVLVEGGHQAAHRLRQCGCPVIREFSEITDCFEFIPGAQGSTS